MFIPVRMWKRMGAKRGSIDAAAASGAPCPHLQGCQSLRLGALVCTLCASLGWPWRCEVQECEPQGARAAWHQHDDVAVPQHLPFIRLEHASPVCCRLESSTADAHRPRGAKALSGNCNRRPARVLQAAAGLQHKVLPCQRPQGLLAEQPLPEARVVAAAQHQRGEVAGHFALARPPQRRAMHDEALLIFYAFAQAAAADLQEEARQHVPGQGSAPAQDLGRRVRRPGRASSCMPGRVGPCLPGRGGPRSCRASRRRQGSGMRLRSGRCNGCQGRAALGLQSVGVSQDRTLKVEAELDDGGVAQAFRRELPAAQDDAVTVVQPGVFATYVQQRAVHHGPRAADVCEEEQTWDATHGRSSHASSLCFHGPDLEMLPRDHGEVGLVGNQGIEEVLLQQATHFQGTQHRASNRMAMDQRAPLVRQGVDIESLREGARQRPQDDDRGRSLRVANDPLGNGILLHRCMHSLEHGCRWPLEQLRMRLCPPQYLRLRPLERVLLRGIPHGAQGVHHVDKLRPLILVELGAAQCKVGHGTGDLLWPARLQVCQGHGNAHVAPDVRCEELVLARAVRAVQDPSGRRCREKLQEHYAKGVDLRALSHHAPMCIERAGIAHGTSRVLHPVRLGV
mmetsp:Transcript_108844/g.338128  ORF Transcript_108844/g.338128 Transcript_108844/m.338128 type:complete len:623 (+) Transcript_108844:44-1912(+)